MIKKIHTIKLVGIEAVPVTVEAEITSGIGIHLIGGLTDAAVKESLLRTVTAMQATGYRIPGKKIVINLAPAETRKDGSGYDLPIALAILAASGQIKGDTSGLLAYGELGLDGKLRTVPGSLQTALLAKENDLVPVLPLDNAFDAFASTGNTSIIGVRSLQEAVEAVEFSSHKAADRLDEDWRDRSARFHETKTKATRNQLAAIKKALKESASKYYDEKGIKADDNDLSVILNAAYSLACPTPEDEMEINKILSIEGRPYGEKKNIPVIVATLDILSPTRLFGNDREPGLVTEAHKGLLILRCQDKNPSKTIRNRISEILHIIAGIKKDRHIRIRRYRQTIEWPADFTPVLCDMPEGVIIPEGLTVLEFPEKKTTKP